MPLGKVVGLGPRHIVLDGDPVGTQPTQQPLHTFGPCLLWPNGHPSQQLLSSCIMLLWYICLEININLIQLHFWTRFCVLSDMITCS